MLRWEACESRDVRKAGEEEDWMKKKRDRWWKRLSDEAVDQLGQHLKHPNKGKKRKRDNLLYWNGHNLFAHQLLGVYF